ERGEADQLGDRIGGAKPPHPLCERESTQIMDACAKRFELIRICGNIFLEIQTGDRPARILLEEIKLPLVKTIRSRTSNGLRLGFRHHTAIQETKDIVPVRISKNGQVELFHVSPQKIITGICEVLGAGIRVEALGEAFPLSADVSPGSGRSFQNDDIVAAFGQLVGAREARKSSTRDNHALSSLGG